MQLYDYSSYLSLNGIDTGSYYDNTEVNNTQNVDVTEQFNNVLQDYLNKEYQTELEQAAIDVSKTSETETSETETNSGYLSDLSESMLNTGSGRKVIASMIENQIMGIVTGNVDEDLNETLQSLLLGTEATNTASSLEQTLMSLQSIETQTDKE